MIDLQWDRAFALEQAGDDTELLEELLTLLVDTSENDLEKIKMGMTAGDGDMVADAAHSIKGAAASLGIEGLRQAAYEFEKKGRGGQLADLDIGIIEDLVGQLPALKG